MPLPGVAVDSEARVIAVSGTTTAVYLPTLQPEMVVYDDTGTKVSTTLRGRPTVTGPAAVTRAGDLFTWWTGSGVEVFDGTLGHPLRRGDHRSAVPGRPGRDHGRQAAHPGGRRPRRP